MNKEIANFFLKFSHDIIIIPILVLGYIWLNRKLFYHTICITLLSMIYSRALKNYFQISSQYGLVFPSGHTLTAATLYGYIALQYRKKFLWFIACTILIMLSYSLIYFGYHNIYHIAGGIFFAGLLIFLYDLALKNYPNILKYSIIPLVIIMLVYINYKQNIIMGYLWMVFYCLIGIFISENYFCKEEGKLSIKEKILATLICLTNGALAFFIFQHLLLASYIYEIKWLIIGASLPISRHLSKKLLSNYTSIIN